MEKVIEIIRNGGNMYPQRKIPPKIAHAISKEAFPIVKRREPARVYKPVEPKLFFRAFQFFTSILFALITLLLLTYTHIIDLSSHVPKLPIYCIGCVPFLIPILIWLRIQDDSAQGRYENELDKYQHDLQKYWREYESWENYNKIIDKHKEQWELDPKKRDKLLPFIIQNLPSSLHLPEKINRQHALGVAEKQFSNTLRRYFPNYILESHALRIDGFGTKQVYEPDFVIFDRASSICIDLEIDEPYNLTTLQPCHYQDSNDSDRDAFFLNNGWFVLRFSEEQIVKFPDACCKEIATFLNLFMNPKIDMSLFAGVADLERKRRWDYTTARELAAIRFRQSYLNT